MNEINITQVMFEKNEVYKKTDNLWQYDYGQILSITGLNLPKVVNIDFSLTDGKGESITQVGMTNNGVTQVKIPNILLKNENTQKDYSIYAFIYVSDGEKGNTVRKIVIPVRNRPVPKDVVTPEEEKIFDEVVNAVNKAAERAETSEKNAKVSETKAEQSYQNTLKLEEHVNEQTKYVDNKVEEFEQVSNERLEKTNEWMNKAEAWTHGHVNYPENNEDNAKYYSDLAKQSAEQAGFVKFHINEFGRLILQRTQNIKDSLDFRLILSTGRLEVVFK